MYRSASLLAWISLGAGALAGLVPKATTNKPVFAHYMVGGVLTEHCRQDIVDAQSLGIDAFAINYDQYAWWSNNTVNYLFDHADELGFKIFFSFDMSGDYFATPSEYSQFLGDYIARDSYYTYNDVPLVSTFGGESVTTDEWKDLRSAVGDILIVPSFYQTPPSATFFDEYSELDGIFNWNSWPQIAEGKVYVPTAEDKTFQSAAQSSGKLFMMGVSPLQFKHMNTDNNWYRRGERNLEYRLGQVLSLQPDMIELQTWNDAGESHYMGNFWPEVITGDAIPAYTDGYNHTGYWEILPSFIQAWKRGDTTTANMVPTNGATAQGVFWHHTLLTTADCSSDQIGKPAGIENASNAVQGIILVKEGQTGLTVSVWSGSTLLGTKKLVAGFNRFVFTKMTTGTVTAQVLNGEDVVVGASGPLAVVDTASVCNYNFQVVALSA
ncbi:hypothetical protein G7Z17_g353 [Cylindrodendrum hubeiense]|uniref:Glycoside hydrolase family 71 protein n=1 Tax=Cylindrodendrum hubeiense TaxID=595255 RepID=A0A9P5HHX2_9HYPO|nr:hypothetical protein G7Z17_g353 [Cylindrodendrum hubeiense]